MKEFQLNNREVDVDAINNLKNKVIKDFNNYIKRLQKGYQDDYSVILNEINFIEVHPDLDNQTLIYEYYMNYGV